MSKVKDFKKDVMHEINMLKLHATDDEKRRLDFRSFSYYSESKCIYGQLTRSCQSDRAKELMDLSCIRVMNLPRGVSSIDNKKISDEDFLVNGENTGQGWTVHEGHDFYRDYGHLSALEGYICTKNAKNKEIIDYIKGKIDKLVL